MNIEWYCCNYCYNKLIDADRPFSLTQCGHIFCYKCISAAQKCCPQCKAQNVPSVTLNIPLQPNLSVFFSPFDNMLDNLQKAIKFQHMQMNIVMQKNAKTLEKYSAIKKEYWLLTQKVEHLKKKIKNMEADMKQKEMAAVEQKHSILSPFFSGQYDKNANFRHSTSALNSSSSLRQRMLNVHFSPDVTPKRTDNVFRVPSSINVPRSRRSSGGSAGSQKRTPFSGDSS